MYNALFRKGKVPKKPLHDFYQGTIIPHPIHRWPITTYTKYWKGKSFDGPNAWGINILHVGEKMVKKYPFKTYVGKGIKDRDKMVFKIDYNIAQNPFWLRLVVDEIVAITPREFLGKVHVRILPGLTITCGFFTLKR